ncbi:MAG: IS200/IS605 family transposase [Acidobacteria bacterium]|nr:MAG: IS200/IS605 family transposase [Acidobacteriota bacterium]
MSSAFHNLRYHLVFSTKNRYPLIHRDLTDSLYSYMGGIINKKGGHLLTAGGMPDHVHLLLGIKPSVAVSAMVKTIKGGSSWWISQLATNRPQPFAWQEGYGIFTVSESRVADVRRYILNQEKHHRDRSFQDELAWLLEAHGIHHTAADLA